MRIYLLSGLGADGRIYDRLKIHLKEHEIIPLNWVHPGKSKTIAEYAQVLHQHYQLESPFYLGGVSLGGMIAQEWAKLCHPQGLLLISTVCHRFEIPKLLKFADKSGLVKLFSKSGLVSLASTADKFVIKSPSGRNLFYEMLHEADPDLMVFGARAATAYHPSKNESIPVVRIHGTRDRVFPISLIKDGIERVEGGTHFMIVDRVSQVAEAIRRGFSKSR